VPRATRSSLNGPLTASSEVVSTSTPADFSAPRLSATSVW